MRAKKHQNQHSTDKTAAEVRRPSNLVHTPSLFCLFVSVFPHYDTPCSFLLPSRCNGLCLLHFSLLLLCGASTVTMKRLKRGCRMYRIQGCNFYTFCRLQTRVRARLQGIDARGLHQKATSQMVRIRRPVPPNSET